ncbi:hypothetical protein AAF712_010749 [Marasmius tenuissimus]|uniref:Uncharacterized protein n=1 Tax=Marasmius tenuissimus TaxID=585030 RepID=A0ABR2ZNU4_9AGAR|nr:hypothetical protein PM082_014529 [Marasmius tenuissimus]
MSQFVHAAEDDMMYHSVYGDDEDVQSLSFSVIQDRPIDQDNASSDISFESSWTGISDDEDIKAETGSPSEGKLSTGDLPSKEEEIRAIPDEVDVEEDDSYCSCGSQAGGDEEKDHGGVEFLEPVLALDDLPDVQHTEAIVGPEPLEDEPANLASISTSLAALDAKIDAILSSITPPTQAQPDPRIKALEKQLDSVQGLLANEKNFVSKLELELGDALRDVEERDNAIKEHNDTISTMNNDQREREAQIQDMELKLAKANELLTAEEKKRNNVEEKLKKGCHAKRKSDARDGGVQVAPVKSSAGVPAQAGAVVDVFNYSAASDEYSLLSVQYDEAMREHVTQLGLKDARIDELEHHLEEVKADLEASRDGMDRLRTKFEAQDAEADTLEEQICALETDNESLRHKKDSLENEVMRLEGLLDHAVKRRDDIEAESREHRQATLGCRKEVEQLKSALETKSEGITTLRKQASSLQNVIQQQEATIAELTQNAEDRKVETQALRIQLERSTSQLTDSQKMFKLSKKAQQKNFDAQIASMNQTLAAEKTRSQEIANSEKATRKALELKEEDCRKALEELRRVRRSGDALKQGGHGLWQDRMHKSYK